MSECRISFGIALSLDKDIKKKSLRRLSQFLFLFWGGRRLQEEIFRYKVRSGLKWTGYTALIAVGQNAARDSQNAVCDCRNAVRDGKSAALLTIIHIYICREGGAAQKAIDAKLVIAAGAEWQVELHEKIEKRKKKEKNTRE